MRRLLAYLSIVLLACCCGLDEPVSSDVSGNIIEFSASKMRVITKAGDSAEPFADGAKFRLFAVGNGTDWSSDGTKFYNIEGTGDSSGNVNYTIDDSGKKASYDVGKNLDFYGVTYGDASDVAVTGSAGSAPEVSASLVDNSFPDLMYSSNLKNKNSSSGLLRMEFRHALSKLRFEVLKQDETADDDKKLEHVVLKKVVLKGSAGSAVFNVKTGEWSYEDASVQDRIVYASDTGLKVTETAQMLQSGGAEIEMLAVPNTGQLALEVTLDMYGDTGSQDYKVVEYDLMSSETEKLVLEQNHEYTFSIAVLKNDVRIVTVTPKVYEWVDVELDADDAYFGQPVYFAGLMWMDRNLGATSADCENDWYNSIGYYYQHGRNIPYIVDVETYRKRYSDKKSFSFNMISGSARWNADAVCSMNVIYTYDDQGKKVYTAKFANKPDGTCLYDNLAKNPGEAGKEYSYIMCEADGTDDSKRVWAITDFDQTDDTKNENQIYWLDVENQPCPRGWRLPSKNDLYTFMPEDNKLLWDEKYKMGENMISSGKHKFSEDKSNNGKWAYRWSYFAGVIKVDSDADQTKEFSAPIPDPDGHSRVYGIKFVGENRAYRVMFEKKTSAIDPVRQFVRISKYDTEVSDEFIVNASATEWNLHKFDWSTPAEYMDVPLSGFMHQGGFTEFGSGGILRTSEASTTGNNWTLYLRSGSNGVCVTDKTRRTLGENVRCVRDVNAK